MSKLTPEAVLRTGQIHRYDDVRNMIERYGFDVREGNGTSHVIVTYPNHPDMRFTLNKSPKKRDYQYEAAKACLEIIERSHAQEIEVEEHQTASIPTDVRATVHGNSLILRHAEYPCIGMGLPYDVKANGIAEIATRRASTLREQASKLKDKIKSAEEDYGIHVNTRNGNLILEYMGQETTIPPYNIITNQNPLETIDDVIADVERSLESSKNFYAFIQKCAPVSDFELDIDSENPSILFSVTNGYTKSKKHISALLAPNGAVSDNDQIRMVHEVSEHLFEEGTFRAMRECYGIEVTGKQSHRLVLDHPISGLRTIKPNPRPLLQKATTVFERSVKNDDDQELAQYDVSWLEQAIDTWNEMEAFKELAKEHINSEWMNIDYAANKLRQEGFQSKLSGIKKPGDIGTYSLSASQDQVFSCPAIKLRLQGNSTQNLIPVSHKDALQEFVTQVRKSKALQFIPAAPQDPLTAAVKATVWRSPVFGE